MVVRAASSSHRFCRVLQKYSVVALVSSSIVGCWSSSSTVRAFSLASHLPTHRKPSHASRLLATAANNHSGSDCVDNIKIQKEQEDNWRDSMNILPFQDGSHRSAKVIVPPRDSSTTTTSSNDGVPNDPFDASVFAENLQATIAACRQLGKTSLWLHVPMSRAALIEQAQLESLGFHFHHTVDPTVVVLNQWLIPDTPSKVPAFSTHHVGVGALVVNPHNDTLLCVRELRTNYRPWKIPTGLADPGESIGEAAEREVWEETQIRAKFHSIVGFRQTHGMAHGQSDLFFVCRLDPVEEQQQQPDGTRASSIPEPVPQACEIATAAWVPLSEYRAMVHDPEHGHPMMAHVLDAYDSGMHLPQTVVESVVPGRKPNAIFVPTVEETNA